MTSPALAQTFYVSPDGDDVAAGSIDAPWRTLAGARDNLRTGGHLDGAGDLTVFFRGGTYALSETVVFGLEDSGAPNQRVTYAAMAGETPVFTSLVPVSGWSTFLGPVQRARLPAGIQHVRYLQDSSESWMPRSATAPFVATETGNCLECTYDDPAFQANKSNVQYPHGFSAPDWSHADEYDLRVTTLAWELGVLPIRSVDVSRRRIHTAVPHLYELRRDLVEDDVQNINWIMNSVEGIDEPGEWAVVDGWIYLWPTSGTGDIFVPRLTELVRVDEGTADGNASFPAPVENVHFRGLTFTGGDFYALQPGDITVQHDWSLVDRPTALVRLRNVRNCSVTDSTFTKSGSTGLRVDRYGQNIAIENNKFSYLGREAVVLAGRAPDRGDVLRNNLIRFNEITATGREKWAAPAILIDQGSSNTVSWNTISDTDFTAIVLTAPRQLVLLSHGETGGPSHPDVREFHYQEIPTSLTQFVQGFEEESDGSREGMQFTYNVDNRVTDNALIDVTQGRGFFVNGYVYVSGAQRHGTNFIERNYLYDSSDNVQNNMAFYSDSDQDNAEYLGNMVHNLDVGDDPPFPLYNVFAQWADSVPSTPSGRILLQGNVTLDSTFSSHVSGLNFVQDGNVSNGVGGNPSLLSLYEDMYTTLCPDSPAPSSPWPGSQEMQAELVRIINQLGGTVPDCAIVAPEASFVFSPALPIAGETVRFADASSGEPTSWTWSFGDGASSTERNPQHTYSSPGTYQVTLDIASAAGIDSTTQTLSVEASPHGSCSPSGGNLCLNRGRFRVDVDFRDFEGNAGVARVVPTTPADDSGLFWFFAEENWEMLVKVLDGCAINGHFWVFAAATTDVEYTLRVSDTLTGAASTYFNPLGNAAEALADTQAFAGCDLVGENAIVDTPRAASEHSEHLVDLSQSAHILVSGASVQATTVSSPGQVPPCADSEDELCLTGGRFLAEVTFRDFQDGQGSGQVVPFRSDDSGMFWFFDEDNWEVLVKVIDGCTINDHFWVFAAATTNVEYTLELTDSVGGVRISYENPLGTRAAAITDTEAFACD